MQIISHRGAKGLANENSLDAIRIASQSDVRYIEFDIQHTKNGHVIIYHDTTTPKGMIITQFTLKTIHRELPTIPTLKDALHACSTTPALVESKTIGTIARSLKELKKFPETAIASFISDEILAARINAPSHKTFLLQRYHPFGILKKAIAIDAHGIGINKNWLPLLPYYYWRCNKRGMHMYTYTLNSVVLARIINYLMPNLLLCTDNPDKIKNK